MQTPQTTARRRRIGLEWAEAVVVGALVLVLLAYVGFSWWRVDGVFDDARGRVPKAAVAALDARSGDDAHALLVIGDDARRGDDRGNADTIALLRVDGSHSSLVSIGRDVLLDAAGGADRGSTIYARDGAAALIDAVSRTLDQDVTDVAIVRFEDVRGLVDELGGVTLDNPEAFVTEPFDGGRWRFAEGEIELTGRRALAYARARSTTGDGLGRAGESTRIDRQQRVLRAIVREFSTGDVVLHPRRTAEQVVGSAAVSMSARDAVGVGEEVRSGIDVTCVVGGERRFVSQGERVAGITPRRDGLLVVPERADLDAVIQMAAGDRSPGKVSGGEHPTRCRG